MLLAKAWLITLRTDLGCSSFQRLTTHFTSYFVGWSSENIAEQGRVRTSDVHCCQNHCHSKCCSCGKRGGGSKSMIFESNTATQPMLDEGEDSEATHPREFQRSIFTMFGFQEKWTSKWGVRFRINTRMDDWERNQPKWYSHFLLFLCEKQSGSGENFKVPQRKRSAESKKAATKRGEKSIEATKTNAKSGKNRLNRKKPL